MITVRFGIQVDMTSDEQFGLNFEQLVGTINSIYSTSQSRIVAGTTTGATVTLTGEFDLTNENTVANSTVNSIAIRAADSSLIFSASGFTNITVQSLEDFSALDTLLNQITQGVTVFGSRYDDVLIGEKGNDNLDGGAGNDTLNGGPGADSLRGRDGNDVYVIDQTSEIDKDLADAGVDTVRSNITYILGEQQENLVLTGNQAINGTGNNFNNNITGNGANNILTGGQGNDILNGKNGNDLLIGGPGNDHLIGGPGLDSLRGGGGHDSYTIERPTEINISLFDPGVDTVNSSVTYTLGRQQEHLSLTGIRNINGIGNTSDNRLIGNKADNVLKGAGGDDVLKGNVGNDKLIGGAGNDTLRGGIGDDKLKGGNGDDSLNGGDGVDMFIFGAVSGTGNVDIIIDFIPVDDVIKLKSKILTALSATTDNILNAVEFKANTTGTADEADDRIIYNTTTGDLYYDTDGNGSGTAVKFAILTNAPTIDEGDFIVAS